MPSNDIESGRLNTSLLEPKITDPLESGKNSRLVIKNFVSFGSASVLERIINMVAGIFARRALGPGPIGLVSWAVAVGSYLTLLVRLGIETIARRKAAVQPQNTAAVAGLVISIELTLAIAVSLILLLMATIIDRPDATRYLLALQAINLLLIPIDFAWLLYAHERMAGLGLLVLANAIAQTVAIVVLVRSPTDLYLYATIAYPFRVLLSIAQAVYVSKMGIVHWPNVKLHLSGARQLILESFPLGLSTLTIMLYSNSDVVILGITRSAIEVGLYATAYNLMLTSQIIVGALFNSFFPSLARAASDQEMARQVSGQLLRGMVWLGFPIAAIGWAVGRHAVTLLYGVEFNMAGVYLEWLCLNVALLFFDAGTVAPLMAWGAQKRLFYCTLAGAITNVGLNVLLIPRFGPPAAILTTFIAEVVVISSGILARRDYFPLPWFKQALPALAICIPAAAVGRWLANANMWWLGIIISAAIILAGAFHFERSTFSRFQRMIWKSGNP